MLWYFLDVLAVTHATEQCWGADPPQPRKDLLYGCDQAWDTANQICCNNHRYAEPWGFQTLPAVDLFNKLDRSGPNVFYDSVCGAPLFVAPIGRSFDEWKAECIEHGWPSFRPAETVDANVKVMNGGRMESICGTHLGHDLPDFAGARYCIDLVCIAGKPGSANLSTTIHMQTTFDPNNFISKKDTGNVGRKFPTWVVVVFVLLTLLLACILSVAVLRCVKRQQARTQARQVGVAGNSPTSQPIQPEDGVYMDSEKEVEIN
eukprot:g74153.t1